MNIQRNNIKVSIGSKEFLIQDKFSLINGKIKKNLLNKYKNDLFLEFSGDLNKIPIEKLIGLLQEESEEFHKFVRSIKLLDFLHEYRKIASNNITISSQYNEIIQNLILILKYNELLKEKEVLLRELEVSEQYKKSSDATAITDLLKKLNKSLATNKKKLEFLEEDYLQRKNQVDQIKKVMNEYNSKIQELTNQKKHCFSQINRITREMAGETQGLKKEKKNDILESNSNLSNAEKIRKLQKKAKDIQFEINNIRSKKDQTQLKLEELIPIFEVYRNDYQAVLEIINTEEKRIKDLQSALKSKIKDGENTIIKEIDLIDLKLLRPSQEIKDDIEKKDSELDKITIPGIYYDPHNPRDLSPIIKKLTEFNQKIKNRESDIIITLDEKETSNCIEQFRELENALNEIESLTNRFLFEINLKSQFRIIVNDNHKSFYINLKFIRKDKEQVDFEELTTPEKIFFIIVFYISIKLYIKIENIIFSNVSILSKYNKAGSIYRTIRIILPIFEREDSLSKFNLIFIISNLELKKEIKNLKITTIKEN